jgi:hypothetical protein
LFVQAARQQLGSDISRSKNAKYIYYFLLNLGPIIILFISVTLCISILMKNKYIETYKYFIGFNFISGITGLYVTSYLAENNNTAEIIYSGDEFIFNIWEIQGMA